MPAGNDFSPDAGAAAKRTSLGEGSVDLLLLFLGAAHLR